MKKRERDKRSTWFWAVASRLAEHWTVGLSGKLRGVCKQAAVLSNGARSVSHLAGKLEAAYWTLQMGTGVAQDSLYCE